MDQALGSLTKVDIAVAISELRCNVKHVFASQAISYLLERFENKGLSIITAPMTFIAVSSKTGQQGQQEVTSRTAPNARAALAPSCGVIAAGS